MRVVAWKVRFPGDSERSVSTGGLSLIETLDK